MAFHKIEYEHWERKELFEFFRRTTVYTTVQVDITGLLAEVKRRGCRFYPAIMFCVAKVVNEHAEFRCGYDPEQNIGVWDRVIPLYTIPRKDRPELFSMQYTHYTADFTAFHNAYVQDVAAGESCGRLFCREPVPANVFYITAVPRLRFSSIGFDSEGKDDLTPFFVFGKYETINGKVLLPVTGEFSHSVNDGYHISRFFAELEETCNSLFASRYTRIV